MKNSWGLPDSFGHLNPVADSLFWSFSAWQCVSLTGLFSAQLPDTGSVLHRKRGMLESGNVLAWKSMVIMSGRCLLLSFAESVLLERSHSVWLLLWPFLSLKSLPRLDERLTQGRASCCVLILWQNTGVFILFFLSFFLYFKYTSTTER